MKYVTDVRAIIAGYPYSWTGDTGVGAIVSYRFVAPDDLPPPASLDRQADAVHSFTAVQRDAFRQAADAFEDVADLKFVETTGPAMIDIYAVSGSEKWAGWANLPVATLTGTSNGELVIDRSVVRDFASLYGQDTLLHEIGHAVGLSHPHQGRFRLPERLDDQGTTVMSYDHRGGHGLRALDREALDALYGSTGANDGWTVSGGFGGWRIVGTDADDRVAGLLGTNTLRGRGGDDVLGGRERADLLIGGRGDDLLAGLDGADDLRGGPGADTLLGLYWGQRQVADGSGNRLAGGAGADRLVGAGSDDILRGGRGADRLDGGAGADLLAGGRGDDILTGAGGADRFVFGPGARGDRDVVRDLELGTDALDLRCLGVTLSDAAIASRAGGRNTLLTFDAADFDLVLKGVDAGSLAAHYDL